MAERRLKKKKTLIFWLQ